MSLAAGVPEISLAAAPEFDIQAAVDAAEDGEIVHLPAGVYHQAVVIHPREGRRHFTVRGSSNDVTALEGVNREVSAGPIFPPGLEPLSMIQVESGASVSFEHVVVRNAVRTPHPFFSFSASPILNQGQLTLVQCEISGNQISLQGGAIFNDSGADLEIVECQLVENFAGRQELDFGGAQGGAIYNAGRLVVRKSTFHKNTCLGAGGAIFNQAGGIATLEDSTLFENQARAFFGAVGGGVSNFGRLLLRQCTVSGNLVRGQGGGGIYAAWQGETTLENSTVTQNSAGDGFFFFGLPTQGGGIFVEGEMVTGSSIIAENHCDRDGPFTQCTGEDLAGGVRSAGYNLIGNADFASVFPALSTDQLGSGDRPINPRLKPLADNGGPTRTHALWADSPAIDRGFAANGGFDQRAEPPFRRLIDDVGVADALNGGGGDVGAFEFQAPVARESTTFPADFPDLRLSKGGVVRAMVVSDDGSLIVGGSFSTVNGEPRGNLAKLDRAGVLDAHWRPLVDGEVHALALRGTDLFVGGLFDSITVFPENTAAIRRDVGNLAKLDIRRTGSVATQWRPEPDSTVRALALAGTNLWVGGSFLHVAGQDRQYLTWLGVGAVATNANFTSWDPSPDASVRALVVTEDAILVGGDFGRINGETRRKLARLRRTADHENASGKDWLDERWTLGVVDSLSLVTNLTVEIQGTQTNIVQTVLTNTVGTVYALHQASSWLYVGGEFARVGESERRHLARIRLSDPAAPVVDASWDPAPDGPVHALAGELGTPALFVGGQFEQIDGNGRTNLAKLEENGQVVRRWTAAPNGTVHTLVQNGPSLYVGGEFTLIDGEVHPALGKLDPVGARLDVAFGASVTQAGEVRALARQPDGKVIVGGDFLFANELPRAYLARVNADGSLDASWAPSPDGIVEHVLAEGADIFVAGAFRKLGSLARHGLAKLSASNGDGADPVWNPDPDGDVRVWTLAGDEILMAGTFRSIGGRPVSGLAKVSRNGTGAADRTWRPENSAALTAGSFVDLLSFVRKLDVPLVSGIPFSEFLRAKLSSPTRSLVNSALGTDSVSLSLVAALVRELNVLLENSEVWPEREYAGAELRPETRWRLQQQPRGEALTRAKRLLLEDIYAGEILSNEPRIGGEQLAALSVANGWVFVGGDFVSGTVSNLARLHLDGAGSLDANWGPNPDGPVRALAIRGTNLYVGGAFHGLLASTGRVTRRGGGLLIDAGSAVAAVRVDPDWDPDLDYADIDGEVRQIVFGDDTAYLAGRFNRVQAQPRLNLAQVDLTNARPRPLWTAHTDGPVEALLVVGGDLYLGGRFEKITGQFRGGFGLLPSLEPPVLVQTGTNTFRIFPSPSDGLEVAGFFLTQIEGGQVRLGETALTNGAFVDFARAAQGLAWVPDLPGGVVTITVSATRSPDVRAGDRAELPSATLTTGTQPVPVFALGQRSYVVREGRGVAVITVVRQSPGTGTVRYETVAGTGADGVKFLGQSGGLFFDEASTEQTIRIAIADELQRQGDQTFTIRLRGTDTAAVAEPSVAVVTIQDNDIVGDNRSVLSAVPPSTLEIIETFLTADCLGGKPTTAGWRLHGESGWHALDTGVLIRGAANNYLLEFKPVAGFASPQPITVPLDGTVTNLVVASSEAYLSTTNDLAGGTGEGSLQLELSPTGALAAGAQWRLEGGDWHDSGEVLAGVPVGQHLVEFREVVGYQAPPARHVVVVAQQINSYAGTYLVAPDIESEGVIAPERVPFTSTQASTNNAWSFNGQILTEQGLGTGVAVKSKVVLTAAHVLLDDANPTNRIRPESIRWLFQKDATEYLPPSQSPRGVYLLDGYAAQRQQDRTPGVSSARSRSLDAAALFFLETAARGGAAGFLVSDQVENEWLLSQRPKILAGYPVKSPPIAESQVGSLFATRALTTAWRHLGAEDELVYSTPAMLSYPGASGGSLYTRADDQRFYPAAIYLGVVTNANRPEAVVRAIDSLVADILNKAEVSANGGGNFNDSTKLGVDSGDGGNGPGALQVELAPAAVVEAGARWMLDDLPDLTYASGKTISLGAGAYGILSTPVAGYRSPARRVVEVQPGGKAIVTLEYLAANPQPQSISFGDLGASQEVSVTFGQAPLPVGGRATSGRPVTLQLVEGADLASLDGSSLRLANDRTRRGVGRVVLRGTVEGDTFDFLPATNDLVVTIQPQPVQLSFGALTKVYDGLPAQVSVASSVPDVPIRLTFGEPESPQPPSDVGSYTVRAVVTDANFTGSAASTYEIRGGAQSIQFPELADRRWGDADFEIQPISSAGLPLLLTISGPATLSADRVPAGTSCRVTLTGIGDVTITVAQPGEGNFATAAPVTRRFTVRPQAIQWEFGPTTFVYDGSPKPVTVTTQPPAVPVQVRYNGQESPPVAAGRYDLEASITSPLFTSATPLRGEVVVERAPQTLDFPSLPSISYGTSNLAVVATASSGLPVVLEVVEGPGALAGPRTLSPAAAGTIRLRATQGGNANYLAAPAVEQAFVVRPANATVSWDVTRRIYDGTVQGPSIVTDPPGLPVEVRYAGATNAPLQVGTYPLEVRVVDPNFTGQAKGLWEILPANATFTFDPARLKQRFDGQSKAPVFDTIPPGLPVHLRFDGDPAAPSQVGTYLLSASIEDLNYVGTTNRLFTIFPASDPPSVFSLVARRPGELVFEWKVGALQSAETLSGGWEDVPGARSPAVVAPRAAFRFYRLRD